MIRRPRAGEDDLVEMMEEFEKNTSAASTVVNKRKSTDKNEESQKKPKSVFAKKREQLKKGSCAGAEPTTESFPVSVLSEIQEREVVQEAKPPRLQSSSAAFPDIIKLEDIRSPKESKASLFSQQFMKMKQSLPQLAQPLSGVTQERDEMEVTNSSRIEGTGLSRCSTMDIPGQIGEKSYIVDGSGLQFSEDVGKLHEENVSRLQSMSEEEILAEQSKLFQSLDPKLIDFLTKKRATDCVVPRGPARFEMAPIATTEFTETADDNEALKKYPGMNLEEPEKKEWMTDIPETDFADVSKDGHTARFGFDGSLLDPKANIDVQSGLYHHGEEPGKAGYTLGELFTLIRSSNSRQRVIALDTLSAILDKYWSGYFDGCFSVNPVEEMVRSGLVSLLRCCMDEGEESVVYSALHCLANLIAPQGEESALDLTNLYSPEQPHLAPVIEAEEKEEEEELKDHELIQLDMVQGILRMDILARIRYILTVLRPGPGIVLASLRILIRISRHSLNASKMIVNCPGLLQTILVEFLPPLLPHTFSTTTLYGAPVSLACKLIRILSLWEPALANSIYQNYHIGQSLMAYLTVDPTEAVIPTRESLLLCIESYRTLCVLLRHNIASERFSDLYPVLVRLLLYLVEKIDVCENHGGISFDEDVGSWLMTTLSAALGCTDSKTLSWSQVENLRKPVETCCRKWMVQLSRSTNLLSTSANNLVGASLTFLSIFYLKLKNTHSFKGEEFGLELEQDFKSILSGYFDSQHYRLSCKRIEEESGYLSAWKEQQRNLSTLPLPGAVLQSGHIHPILNQNSTVFFFSSLYRFLSSAGAVRARLVDPDVSLSQLKGYLGKVAVQKLFLVSNWYSRFEGRMIFWILSNRTLGTSVDADVYKVATVVCGLLQKPDEILVRELMKKIIFNSTLLQSEYFVSKSMETLSLDNVAPLTSQTTLPHQSLDEVLKCSLENLDNIKSTYFSRLLGETVCKKSFAVHNIVSFVPKLMVCKSGTVLPQDWQYYPLLEVYNREESGRERADIPMEDLRNCLAWLLLTDTGNLSSSDLNTAKYYRLATVLLSGNDLFLDPTIHTLLSALLMGILRHGIPDLSISVPGLSSGHDMYLQLIDQFQAVSYGDQLFSMFIVLPLSTSQPVAFRRTLLTEKSDVLRVITLKKDNFSQELLSSFLKVPETHLDILLEYTKALMEKKIIASRNDFLYYVAVESLRNILKVETADDNIKKFQLFLTKSQMDDNLKHDIFRN